MSNFWNYWVWFLIIAFLSFISWLLYSNYVDSHSQRDHHRLDETHDGISESYAPIPVWWAVGMWVTIVFTVTYLILYPGLGRYPGLLNWTTEKALIEDQQNKGEKLQQVLNRYYSKPAKELASNKKAVLLGRRVYRNNCVVCHGKNAKGSWAFPNLTDNDWLYGNTEEAIKISITEGRKGSMPAWKDVLQAPQVQALAHTLSGQLTKTGDADYATYCAACHGANKEGNSLLGAPNLRDDIWLYGGSFAEIKQSILTGRSGEMPAHKDKLSKEKIHLLTAYILSLNGTNNE